MSSLRRLGVAAFATAALLAWPAHAQDPSTPAPELAGSWTYVGGAPEQTQRFAAIDAATEALNPFMREVSRMQVRSRTEPVSSLSIAFSGSRATIRRDGVSVTVPMDGTSATVTRHGSEATVRCLVESGHLVLLGRTPNGRRRAEFEMLSDGRLRMSIRIESGHLAGPVNYQLTYRRAD